MDPVSIVTSILGVIKLPATIYYGLQDMRDAPLAIKNVILEIICSRRVLNHLKDILENDANIRTRFPNDLTEDLVGILWSLKDTDRQLSKTLQPYMNLSTKRRVSMIILQLKWVLGKEKDVEKLRKHLEAHKNTLSLILGMMSNLYLAQIQHQLTQRRIHESHTCILPACH
ncbi:hypothetical protein BDZ91DRAFT_503089 [Kalaharituber pfeilii]|nr:hypothetical protein BDZ91DRAFT_503089 [Kalaharituber pfeilii]